VARAAVVLLMALALAAPAQAATVGLEPRTRPANSQAAVFRAAPGETNAVTVTAVEGGLLFRDARAPVQPAVGCTATADGGVLCPDAQVEVELGDGDDTATIPRGRAEGDVGNDRLTGQGGTGCDLRGELGDDVVQGGSGDDIVEGGGGRDVLRGGAGEDLLDDADTVAGRIDADQLDGGPGDDTVGYLLRRRRVTVDLAARRGGERGERDRLTSIEDVYGGEGDDVLRGTNGANLLDGGPGDDKLIGRRGNDILSGGGGKDTLRGDAGTDDLNGGRGADRLFARDRAIDGVDGGPGRDRASVDPLDIVDGVERFS